MGDREGSKNEDKLHEFDELLFTGKESKIVVEPQKLLLEQHMYTEYNDSTIQSELNNSMIRRGINTTIVPSLGFNEKTRRCDKTETPNLYLIQRKKLLRDEASDKTCFPERETLQSEIVPIPIRSCIKNHGQLVLPHQKALNDPSGGSFLASEQLYVKQSKIQGAGLGLFTSQPIRGGTWICEYLGTHLTFLEVWKLKDRMYLMGTGLLNCHIDAKPHLQVLARYINDNFDETRINAEFVKLKEHRRVLVRAKRNIPADDEIYACYGQIYWRSKKLRESEEALSFANGHSSSGFEKTMLLK